MDVGTLIWGVQHLLGAMSAKDQFTKMLDQLMGQNRDGESSTGKYSEARNGEKNGATLFDL